MSVARDARQQRPHLGPGDRATADLASRGWSALFWEAFRRSTNPMVLTDDDRLVVEPNGASVKLLGYPRSALVGRHVYEFVEQGPTFTSSEWKALLHEDHFSGAVNLVRHDGLMVKVEFAAHPEVVTGRQLVLFVALRSVRGLRRIHPVRPPSEASTPLSGREREIVDLVAMGLSSPEIAAELHLSQNTVRTHVRNAMNKLEARSRAHLVAKTLAEAHHLPSAD